MAVSSSEQDTANERLILLLRQCALQQEAAFQLLYKETSSHLFAVLLRILKVETIAEDALQDTYLKIWTKAGTYDADQGKPLTWMTSVARYQALDVLRSARNRTDRELHMDLDLAFASIENLGSVERDVGDSQLLSICLGRLKEDTQQCVVKAYCEGYSHEELSDYIGAPLGTVKSWIRRALLSLRECIDELS